MHQRQREPSFSFRAPEDVIATVHSKGGSRFVRRAIQNYLQTEVERDLALKAKLEAIRNSAAKIHAKMMPVKKTMVGAVKTGTAHHNGRKKSVRRLTRGQTKR